MKCEGLVVKGFTEFASGAAYEGRKDLGNIYPGDGVRVSTTLHCGSSSNMFYNNNVI